MKRIFLPALFCLFAIPSFSQGMYGVFTGVGATVINKSSFVPRVGTEYLKNVSTHIYLGGALFYEGYHMSLYDNQFAQFGGPGYIIHQQSSYLFITPKVDIAIGHHENFHAFFDVGPGFKLSGDQEYISTKPNVSHLAVYPGLPFDNATTSANIPSTIWRCGLGAAWHMHVLSNWDVVLSGEWGIFPSWLSTNTYGYSGDASMNIRSNYLCAQIGIFRTYNWEPVEARRTWGGY